MSGRPPAEAPDRLFTWVDVDEHLRALAMHRRWPAWLREVSAYWDAVEFTVVKDTDTATVWDWLRSTLGPRNIDTEREVVLLEPRDEVRELPVFFAATDGADESRPRRRPEWNETLLTSDMGDPLPPPDEHRFPGGVTIGAFHSFKGGVGRTLHCVALAHLVASRTRERVLLIDADMEAPGISWMMPSQGVPGEFSFADFMALVHGSAEGDSAEAVGIARPHLLHQDLDGIFVLPAQRDPEKFGPPRIEPRHLLSAGRSPYFLTESLAELAHALGARTALIDLRAGMSEISAPMLLDPRVKRIFVTTASDQSVQGTERLLDELALRAPSRRETDPVPTALITQYHEDEHTDLVESVADRLGEAIAGITSFGGDDGPADADGTAGLSRTLTSAPLRSPFAQQLLALPAAWGEVRELLDRAATLDVLGELADELTPRYEDSDEERLSAQRAESLQRDRRRLATYTGRLLSVPEHASASARLPLPSPLARLLAEHRTGLPVEAVVGMVGSGISSSFLALCRSASWRGFAAELGEGGVTTDAPILPVFTPRHLAPEDRTMVEERRAAAVAPAAAALESDLRATITEALGRDRTDAEWFAIWRSALARAAGRTAFPDIAEEELTALAGRTRLVFVLHGLDDLFPEVHRDARQRQALRVLLVDCRDWLSRLRGRPLGLVAFLRRDLVAKVLGDDAAHFLAEHREYALVWKRTGALRLTAWAADQARALPFPRGKRPLTASEDELSEHLRGLWGERMGRPGSKEVRSQEWFLAALSDFADQIQPGDVLRFLMEAARASQDEPGDWNRLLTPEAMRGALPVCGRAKVESLTRVVPAVGEVLARLAGLEEEHRTLPFTPARLGLTPDEVELLIGNGIIAPVEGEYWMPDLYRSALGFTATRRPPLLTIAKAARRRFPEL